MPHVPPSGVIEQYVSIMKSDEFQQALAEATEIKRADIARFREMLGRSSAVKSLKKLA